jgi:hypothetical protein
MIRIELKGLNFTRCRNWLKKANDCREQDPVTAFISAWISFNHYYSTFAFENLDRFREWSQRHYDGRQGDKAELLFLVHSQEFTEFLANYRQRYPQRLNFIIELPVIDMFRGSRVPENIEGACKLSDLTDEDVFRVIYQIRNNLFHGSKDPMKVQRDQALCVTTSDFMVPLVASMLTGTYGEVLNVYDNSAQELRDQIRQISEA